MHLIFTCYHFCLRSISRNRFVHEFRIYPKSALPLSLGSSTGASSYKKKKVNRVDLMPGDPFQPKYVYDMLHKTRTNLSYKVRVCVHACVHVCVRACECVLGMYMHAWECWEGSDSNSCEVGIKY